MTQWVLAIDLGSISGWALRSNGQLMSGTWDFRPRRGDGAGVRFLRLQAKLDEIVASYQLERIAYELPGFSKFSMADDVVKGLVAHVQSWSEKHKIPCEGFSPGTIKKIATGKGNAKKDAMLVAAREKYPAQNVVDSNQADALFVMELVQ